MRIKQILEKLNEYTRKFKIGDEVCLRNVKTKDKRVGIIKQLNGDVATVEFTNTNKLLIRIDKFYTDELIPILNEKWDKMEGSSLFGDALFTDKFSDVIMKLKAIPELGYKLLCDEKKGYYMICNAEDNNHNDMLSAAIDMGFYYPEMKASWEMDDYIYQSDYNEENYLVYLVIKKDDKNPGDMSTDGYKQQYIYNNFVIYPRDCIYEDTKFYEYYKKELKGVNNIQ